MENKYVKWGEHYDEEIDGNLVNCYCDILYRIGNGYEVCSEWRGTSGGQYSTVWNTEESVEKFADLDSVYAKYGKDYFESL